MKIIKQLQKLGFVLTFASLATLVQATTDPNSKPEGQALGSAGFNDMLGKQIKPGTYATEPQPDGSFLLSNKMQTVSAHITAQGTQFDSIGNSEGKGSFALQLTQWGREQHLQTAESSQIYRDGDNVFHSHANGIAEKFSNSSGGIQQDFIVPVKPEGEGSLHVQLQVSGATIVAKNDGAIIQLNSGRQLTYDRLSVTDSENKKIPAHIIVSKNNMLEIVVDDATAQYPLTIDPTVGDQNWVSMGGVAGLSGQVNAIAVYGTNIYVAGYFNIAGSIVLNNIALWNGSSWAVLGTGIPTGPCSGSRNCVSALVVDGSGILYVGGNFSSAGGVSANNIAKWNGGSWSALGSGVNSVVTSLVISSGNLYVGGSFTTAGGMPASCIAKWDGSNWSALGSGVTGSSNYVYALAFDSSGNLVVGGTFSNAGGIVANNIANWNGSIWSSYNTGMNGTVSSLLSDTGGIVYAGGSFTTAGGVTTNDIAKWDGSSWNALGSGMNGQVNSLIRSSGNIFAGGSFTTAGGVTVNRVAIWNGSSWVTMGVGVSAPNNSAVNSLAVDSSGNVYAGGAFSSAGSVIANNIAMWNGVGWIAQVTVNLGISTSGSYVFLNPGAYVYAVAVDSHGNVYIAGEFANAGQILVNNIVKWDGTNWVALGTGITTLAGTPDVRALVIDKSDHVYVAGFFGLAGGVAVNNIAMWNGSSWVSLGAGIGGSLVYSLTLDSVGNLYAGGTFGLAGGISVNNIAKWDGSSWSALSSGINNSVYALSVDKNNNIYAAGSFSSAGGVSVNNIAMWNGTNWSTLDVGITNIVYALVTDVSGYLYAGGSFSNAGGVYVNNIAMWDGSTWSPLGAGINGGVRALATDGIGNLYAAGNISKAGGVTVNNIAVWKNSNWAALGSGVNGPLYALSVDQNGRLFAGGNFLVAGNTVSSNISYWKFNLIKVTTSAPVSAAFNDVFNVSATSTYGFPVTITTSGGCSGNGTGSAIITMNSATTSCMVIYNQGGDSSHPAADQVVLITMNSAKNDFNADGKSDVLLRNLATGDWNLSLLNGLTVLNQGSLSGVFNDPYNMIVSTADFNGDGNADILTRGDVNGLIPGAFHIDLMSGPNVIGSNWLLTMSTDLNDEVMSTKDFNKDGKADVLLRNKVSGVWTMNYLDGVNNPTISTLNATLDTCYTLQGDGDYDGNGYPDLLLRKDKGGTCGTGTYPWLMYTTNGTANFLASGTIPGVVTSANWGAVVTDKDFDGDGKADLLVRFLTGTTQQWVLYNLNGVGAPSANGTVNVAVQSLWQFAAEGDFNADGKADLLLRNANNGQWYIYLLNNTAILSGAVPAVLMNQLWSLQATDDYNGDGKSDILIRNTSSGQWYMNLINGTAVQAKGLLTINSDVSYVLQND